MTSVNFIGVSKVYDNHTVLDNINLSIEKGEFCCRSGAFWLWQINLIKIGSGIRANL